jgi:putative transposase
MAVDNNCFLGSREYDLNLMSDNGAQPTSEKYEKASKLFGIKHITTSYSNPKGNADTEGFMRTLKEEIIYPKLVDLEQRIKRIKSYRKLPKLRLREAIKMELRLKKNVVA